jgi:two-component system, cell cycle response regulator DivK
MPVVAARRRSLPATPAIEERLPDMLKILVVEDNEMNIDMLTRRLKKKGFEVVVATDGSQAVVSAARERPHLILMDMHLPVMDGWEATRHIKSSETTSRIPIVALTADAMPGDREKAIEAGCDDYETKPIDFQRLLAKMEALLAGASAE